MTKQISINKIVKKVETINNFYINKMAKSLAFAITGVNPHCETTSFLAKKKIIIPSINKLKKKN